MAGSRSSRTGERRQTGARWSIPWRRALLVVPVAAAAIWLSVTVTGAALLRRAAPDTALRVAPYDAQSLAAQAVVTIGGDNRAATRERAAAWAKAALQRDPTVVAAWRSLAIIAAVEGRDDQATALMDFASRLSRRDLPTQLWLIEDEVRRNDVIGALQHYDMVLRTSESGRDLLLPTLVASISHDELVEPVAALLGTEPPWLPNFFAVFGGRAPADENSGKLLELLRAGGYRGEVPYSDLLPARLVTLGEYRTAARVHQALLAGQVNPKSADDQFGRTPRLAPFDWDMVSSGEIRSEPQLRDGAQGNPSLYVYGDPGNSGIAARKLFVLAPGSYRLVTDVFAEASSAPERLGWTVQCAGSSQTVAQIDVTPKKAGGRQSYDVPIEVPASGCTAQWVQIDMFAADRADWSEAWIDRFEIAPR